MSEKVKWAFLLIEIIKLIANIPNILTVARIAACPLLIILLHRELFEQALWLFVIAGISDGLDGYIAKKYNFTSRLGALLDPLADKLLIASAYIMLAFHGHMPFWVLIIVVFRDLVILGGFFIASILRGEVKIMPLWLSKINTVLQIALMAVILGNLANWIAMPLVELVLLYAMVVTTVASGVQYVWLWGFSQHKIDDV